MSDFIFVLVSGIFGLLLIFIFYKTFKKNKTGRKKVTHKQLLENRIKHFKESHLQKPEQMNKVEGNPSKTHDTNVTDSTSKPTSSIKKKKDLFSERINFTLYKSTIKADEPSTEPINSLDQLFSWNPGFNEFLVANISKRVTKCDESKPKTLVCHDMKGGYLEDRFPQGFQSAQCYRFGYWNLIDSFCYFSHNFVTIPPPCWTNAAHIHGVKSFGTVITEWNDGAALCNRIFDDLIQVQKVVDKLVGIAEYYRFDGWLINIENPIQPEHIDNLVTFLELLTETMHSVIPGSEVIWYDSVLNTGELKWQNKLCSANRMFFDVCDGIFLNYNWSIHDLQESLYLSGAGRQFDVYVGVDVFGRGCFGGGGWNTYKAMQVIRERKLSAAIFAPGWVMEKFGEEEFSKKNQKFWELLTSYLYPHYLASFPLATSFCRGYGERIYMNGKVVSSLPWTNLSAQSVRPTFSSSFYQLGDKTRIRIESTNHCTSDGYNGGGCLRICGNVSNETKRLSMTVFRLFKVHLDLCSNETYVASYTCKKKNENVDVFLLCVFAEQPTYMVFCGDTSDTLSRYVIPEGQESNYVFKKPDPKSVEKYTEEDWCTRTFEFSVDCARVLQEVRVVCTAAENIRDDDCTFSVKLGELKLCRKADLTSSLPIPVNLRCRNICITSEGAYCKLSFILSWDYVLDTGAPKCFDIFCEGADEQEFKLSGDELMQTCRRFVGRSFVESYYITHLLVSKQCVSGLRLLVQSINFADVRGKFSEIFVEW